VTYTPAGDRYDGAVTYRRTGRSGLDLPLLSLGLWHNFGDDRAFDGQRRLLLRAFDLGITHFDLANNYGPPYGAAERNAGRVLREDLALHRDELIISTKAGWDMWPGPYGQGGGSRKYMLASLDHSLERLGLEYVDIFYSHRIDPTTPLEETAAALDATVRRGRALYVGISSYGAEDSRTMAGLLRDLGTPLLVHQPSYSMLNRWVEADGLLDVASDEGFGVIAFTPLAQGLLTSRYLNGIPEGSRASQETSLHPDQLNDEVVQRLHRLNGIAREREQTLAQLALAWALRDDRMTSLVIGASSVDQLEENVGALSGPPLTAEELSRIDACLDRKVDGVVDLWRAARLGLV
jgi:L-glyceraldehyde 3-phosphate reductase